MKPWLCYRSRSKQASAALDGLFEYMSGCRTVVVQRNSKSMHFDLDHEGAVVFGEYKYERWPHFGRAQSSYGKDRPPVYLLQEILLADDLFCWAWRSAIPGSVLKALAGFPDGHPELLELAQADPEAFLRMYDHNPALLRVLVSRDGVRTQLRLTHAGSRAPLLYGRHHHVLRSLGWRGTRSLARLLRKVSVQCCRLYLIRQLLSAAEDLSVVKILRHLPVINEEVVRLLAVPYVYRDYHIFYLAASEPRRGTFQMHGMVSFVCRARQELGKDPWPFSGMIRSWTALLRLVGRTELVRYGFAGPFPKEPVPSVGEAVPDGLQIVALDSARLLQEEGLLMENCVFGFIEGILLGDFFAYRMTSPERATVLLVRDGKERWDIEQAMVTANERAVSAKTLTLLEMWLRRAQGH